MNIARGGGAKAKSEPPHPKRGNHESCSYKVYCLYSHISHFYLFSGAKVGKKEIERNLRRLMFFTILTYGIKFACPLWRVFATGSRRNVRG